MPKPLRPVLKRPWIHHLIIIGYILAPFANLLLLKAFLNISFGVIFRNLVVAYGPLATIWLLSAPAAGVSLYFVRKFSWYVFLGHSSLILLDFIVKWIARPAYYAHTVPGAHNMLLLGGNIALVAVVAYLIQRNFRAPYFQVLNRSWREHVRVPIYHAATIDGMARTMNDLSTDGCFVLETGLNRTPGTRVKVSFQSNTLNIDCAGEIMRVTGRGLGIRFMHLSLSKRRDIRQMLKVRFSLRQKVVLPCTWTFHGETRDCAMVNLSNGGCYLRVPPAALCEGADGELKVILPCNMHSYSLAGHIAWVNRPTALGMPGGFGFQFDHRQSRFMKDVTLHYGQGMLLR